MPWILNLDKSLTSILAGIVGLAIGFALQGTLNNTFSGLILSFLPELQIGDWVETNHYAGQVIEINQRNIVIQQADNNYVVISKSKIVEELYKPQAKEEVEFMYTGFGDSSINFIVRFWTDVTKTRDILVAKNNAIIAVKKAFEENSINIPFPISTIDFSNKLSFNSTPENSSE